MNGYEPVDNTPVEIPTRLRLPQTRTDQIRQFIREEISRAALNGGMETLEEADDIEPDDEEAMPFSRYELQNLEPFQPPANPGEAVGQPAVVPPASSELATAPSTPAAPDGTK
ncbi:MAG: hypothetical protein [Arizlama microvirus]|nr:MAG: hypothetical protein [Arizlama microvirus]